MVGSTRTSVYSTLNDQYQSRQCHSVSASVIQCRSARETSVDGIARA